MEIRHIPEKINPTNSITRQARTEDAKYTGQVKELDQELVDVVRFSVNATDEDVQCRLHQFYSKKDLKERKSSVQQQILIETREDQNAVLAVSESRIIVDDYFKQHLM